VRADEPTVTEGYQRPERRGTRNPYARSVVESADSFIARKKAELLAKPVYSKDIGQSGRLIWRRQAVTLRVQSNYPEKVFMIDQLRLERIEGAQLRSGGARIGDVEYRFGCYTVSRTDKWWWGQFAPFIPQADLGPLLEQARAEGTIL
jgi:hypothetical protein